MPPDYMILICRRLTIAVTALILAAATPSDHVNGRTESIYIAEDSVSAPSVISTDDIPAPSVLPTATVSAPFDAFAELINVFGSVSRSECGDGGYVYRLEDGALTVSDSGGAELWRSDPGWWVQDFRLGDVDGDGTQDFIFTLWKLYNPKKTNAVEADIVGKVFRNHLYLYTIIAGNVKPVWCASALPRPIYGFELDNTGRVTPVESGMLLHTQEGEYRDDYSIVASSSHTYAWEGWGFAPVD